MQKIQSINSMTGYARCQQNINKIGLLSCEIKTVNSRFLDIHFKLPDYLNYFESTIRKLLTENFTRGKVDVVCAIAFDNALKSEKCYVSQVNEYLRLFQNIKQLSNNAGIVTQDLIITDLIRELYNKEGIRQQDYCLFSSDIKNDIENNLLDLINKTIINLAEQRKREGQSLQCELLRILSNLKQELGNLESLLPQSMEDLKTKFKFKIKDSLSSLVTDLDSDQEHEMEIRIAQDIVAYLNKIDINEELARLKVHVGEVENLINSGGVVGRRLDFLMQELTREANTLSAKSVSIDFRNMAINLKVYIEQIREQIQNIE